MDRSVTHSSAAVWSALTCQRFALARQKRRSRQVGTALQIKHSRVALILLSVFGLSLIHQSCGQPNRRTSLPAGAQDTLQAAIEDLDAGRFEKLYNEAAPEWRADASLEESKATLQRLRDKLGKAGVRDQQTAREEDTGAGHTVIVIYQTSFERGQAMETFTVLERGGRWYVAKYFVSSTALK